MDKHNAQAKGNGNGRNDEESSCVVRRVLAALGHTDAYKIEMTDDKMVIWRGTFTATCTRNDDGDPEWSGYGGGDNPLMSIFTNDMIYAPNIVPFALEWAWRRWREGEASDDEVHAGLRELFAWIDQTARAKPRGGLWEGAF